MSLDFYFCLIPQNRNFKPSAAQLNGLFDRLAQYPTLFRVHDFKLHSLPNLLSEEEQQTLYQDFEEQDLSNFIEADQYYLNLFIPDKNAVFPYGPYSRLNDYYRNLLAKRKHDPKIGLASSDAENYTARHILLEADQMRTVRTTYLQHQYEHELNVGKLGYSQEQLYYLPPKDFILTAYWIDFPELEQIDLFDVEKIEAAATRINALNTRDLILNFENPPSYSAIYMRPLFLNYPSRRSLVDLLVSKSFQIQFQGLELIDYPNTQVEIFWGINNNKKVSPKTYSRFSYCEARDGSENNLEPQEWLSLETSQLQIHILKECLQQDFEFFCRGKYVCDV